MKPNYYTDEQFRRSQRRGTPPPLRFHVLDDENPSGDLLTIHDIADRLEISADAARYRIRKLQRQGQKLTWDALA